MPYRDIFKRRAAHRRYYQKNVQLYINKNSRRKKELASFVNSLKQKSCSDCGHKYPYYAMDFDHRDESQKLTTINRMVSTHRYSKDKILKEIEKCDLVCANCHRIRTYNRINNARSANGRPNDSGSFNLRSNRSRAASLYD